MIGDILFWSIIVILVILVVVFVIPYLAYTISKMIVMGYRHGKKSEEKSDGGQTRSGEEAVNGTKTGGDSR